MGNRANSATPAPQEDAPVESAPEPALLDPELVMKSMTQAFSCYLAYRKLPQQQFWAVIVPDQAAAYVVSADSLAELADKLRPLHGKHAQVFPFAGQRLGITKPPRFLVSGDERHALFSMTDDPTLDDTGFMTDADDPELNEPPVSTQPD